MEKGKIGCVELRYPWLPRFVRIVDFGSSLIVRYKGREIPYGKGIAEETLKKDIFEGKLEKEIKREHIKIYKSSSQD